MSTRYFVSSRTGALLRRVGGDDATLVDGEWRPTKALLEKLLDESHDLKPITQAEAEKLERLRTGREAR